MVQKVRVNSSNERYNNLNDEQRVYDIEADALIVESKVTSVDGGRVMKNDESVAQFNWWGGDNMNVTYQGVSVTERNEINIAVDTFINEVKESVKQ